MYDRLTPDGAIKERDSLLAMLKMPGAVRFVVPIGSDTEHLQDAEGLLLEALRMQVPLAEIVIWDHDIYKAATAGAEAFCGSTAPLEFCAGNTQVWMFAKDERVSETICSQFGLEGEWLFFAHVFIRSRIPEFPVSVLQQLHRMNLPKPGLDGLMHRAAHPGKFIVDQTTFFIRPEGWVESRPDASASEFALRFANSPSVIEGDEITVSTSYPIAATLFMNGTVARAQEYRANHQTRKEYARAGKTAPTVRAVILRRSEQATSAGSMRGDVEWSCQWMVRGHWRKLHEPRKSDGATVTYVQPHVKGPQDMPFRAPSETVFVAQR